MLAKFYRIALLSLCISIISNQLYAQSYKSNANLPLTVNDKGTNKTLIFYLTGDGGINNFSTKLTENLIAKNYKVIILDSKKYFWEEKTPDVITKDLSPAIDHYIKQTNSSNFVLLGFSFGADASLFLASNLPVSLAQQLKGLILLSPSLATDLEVKVSDLIGFGDNATGKYKTLQNIKKINKPIFCLAGASEDNAFYNGLTTGKTVSKKTIPGSHRYNNDIPLVTNTVISALTSF